MFELQRHIAVKHRSDKKFVCEICGMKFALKLYLNNHIRIRHQPDNEKPFGCTQCSYRVSDWSIVSYYIGHNMATKL